MKLSASTALFLAATVFPVATAAQGSSSSPYSAFIGQWESNAETPRGVITQVFSFSMNGDQLAGTVSGRGGEVPLKNLRVEGGSLMFEIERNFGGNTMVQSVTAKVEGDELTGTMSGGRGGDRPFKAIRKTS